jgi:hypothetical protein
MMTTPIRRMTTLVGLTVLVLSSTLCIAGCGKKDEAPAGAGAYYTGPMVKKQGPTQPSGEAK